MLRKISSKSKLKTRFALVQRLFLLAAGCDDSVQTGKMKSESRNATVRQLKFADPNIPRRTNTKKSNRLSLSPSLALLSTLPRSLTAPPLFLSHSRRAQPPRTLRTSPSNRSFAQHLECILPSSSRPSSRFSHPPTPSPSSITLLPSFPYPLPHVSLKSLDLRKSDPPNQFSFT